ncbi:class I SAM-dependent methyltransferase [bacterium]|nr:class I SAM-dependent methyltransferase [bacterium]
MNHPSNYDHYDYKSSFWGNGKRAYEHGVESRLIQNLLSRHGVKGAHIGDIGCGFGRLFPSYEPFAQSVTLLDYSHDMLAQARASIQTKKPIQFVQGNALSIPLPDAELDACISIRTLHHLEEYDVFLSELCRVTKPGGLVIFEIPNYRHIKNIVLYALGRAENPFQHRIHQLGNRFVNFHPDLIYRTLERVGLQRIETVNGSFFRSEWVKRTVPTPWLIRLDQVAQRCLSWTDLTPSIYCVCRPMVPVGDRKPSLAFQPS